MRTPKLQLTAEQPSTEERWIPPKKYTPCPRAKEKSQQDSRRGEITFRIKSHTFQRYSEGSDQILWVPGNSTETELDLPLSVSVSCIGWSAVACNRGRGSGCSGPGNDISALGRGCHEMQLT